jgi:predicted nucleotide-binding protein (sugar kinase/HSP70/actin superfamily)
MKRRRQLRIGIPRVLNMYAYTPLFSAYLESLGVRAENVVYSDFTTGDMYRAGSSRGSIDPCFPSKIAIAHVHNLVFNKHARHPLQAIFFPMFDVLMSPLVNARGHNACPTTSVTPETVEAAYTKETDLFAERGIRYVHPLVDLSDHKLFARQMFQAWAPILGLSEAENERAIEIGYRELARFESSIRRRAREVLDQLESQRKLGIVMLGRPYHHDPGINHEIPEQFQKLGYPIFSQSTLPLDEDLLERLFGEEVRAGVILHPLDIRDVWKTANSASSNHKIWAAKFTARHPNLVAVEISSFKCGHDAPIYSVIEQIVERSGTPYFSFKDTDENRPANSIKLRVETIDYFLKRYREDLLDRKNKQADIERQLVEYEYGLRECATGTNSFSRLRISS